MESIRKNSKIIGWIGCLLMFIAVFFPFATASLFGISSSVSFIEGDGWIVLVISIITAILIFFNKSKISLIPTAIVLLITLYDGINAIDEGMGLVSLNIGFYLIIIGVVLVTAYSFIFKNGTKI